MSFPAPNFNWLHRWQDIRHSRFFWPCAALLGVVCLGAVVILSAPRKQAVRFAPALHYDLVFKHCMGAQPAEASGRFERSLYDIVRNLAPGAYALSGAHVAGGQLHLYDSGFFELQLPLEARAARSMKSYNVETASGHDRPHTLIGCNQSQLIAALASYGLRPVAYLQPGRKGAIPPPISTPPASK